MTGADRSDRAENRADAAADDVDTERWIDELLRSARPATFEDAGFSEAVLARTAPRPVPMLAPAVAMEVVRASERRERHHTRWTLAALLLGAAFVAAVDGWLGLPSFESGAFLAPGIGLLVIATCLGYLALEMPAHRC
jgi:hypothetical protein